MEQRITVIKGRWLRGLLKGVFPYRTPVIERNGTYLFLLRNGDMYGNWDNEQVDLFFKTLRKYLTHVLNKNPIQDQSENHVSWKGDDTFHILLSRGCRGTLSVEVRPGLDSK